MISVLSAHDIHLSLTRPGRAFQSAVAQKILHGVSISVPRGAGVGLVGSSGSGKSTLLRTLLAMEVPDSGSVVLQDRMIRPGSLKSLRWFRREVQYVPQDPASSLDPRMTVERLLREPLVCLGVEGNHSELIRDALVRVELPGAVLDRQPSELSGGQNQRVAIARAMVVKPAILLADEPVSGLDLPLRNQVLDVLHMLIKSQGLGLLLVSHDLDAVASICTRTAVLADGRIVEEGPTDQVLDSPQHPATRALNDARVGWGALSS
ncbi:ABC transporter ATP-binding protein [Arthrobacter sp. AET 35A]|uniref:ABC transporter ATP-binding protein n=1 Tax=Arthrobacter sp. AET 35A TaxID=2292643 RepID=UPI00178663AF|nr:ABC transporter ATP-binding protein [Arthrobacter sp. AET 35A]MBE0011275.1 ABC transporter ATP-binding protein [Arthrobacter sp. AET 35A]